MASLNPVQGALGHRRAAHLLRRTSFRYTRARVDAFASLTAAEALADLFADRPLQLEQPVYGASNPAPWINPPQPPDAPLPADDMELTRYVMAWWVNEALHDEGMSHKMTFFLHQFLAVNYESGSSMEFYDYLALLRWGRFGNFKKMIAKIVVDNCMLTYIDNDQNFVNNPNENFAREFFELHTITPGDAAGPGDYTTYTEDDIVQAARVFTGFNHAKRHQYVDTETGIPAGRGYPPSHDFGVKTFSNRFGGASVSAPTNDEAGMFAEMQALIDLVFAQEATARNFCRRLYHFFITRAIDNEAENDIIGPLAQTFIASGFEMKPVLEQLLQSEHFFDLDDADAGDEHVGAFIKSPLDLALQALSFFNIPIPDPVTANLDHYMTFYNGGVIERMVGRAGMDLFYPPDVAGYPGYYQNPSFNRSFFNSATIIARYKLPQMLLTGTYAWGSSMDESIGTKLDIAAWLRDSGDISDPNDSYILVSELLQYLFPEAPDNDRFEHFHTVVFLDGLPPADWSYEWQNYLSTGDDTEVKIPLGRLVNAVMYAPEYQVF